MSAAYAALYALIVSLTLYTLADGIPRAWRTPNPGSAPGSALAGLAIRVLLVAWLVLSAGVTLVMCARWM